MIASNVPPEIWTQIFRACILDSNDWEKQRARDLKFKSFSWLSCRVRGGAYPGAQSLALVCREWAALVIGDSLLKFVEASVKNGPRDFDEGYLNEIESAISSYPFSSLHLYLFVTLTPNLINFLRSHSERISVLSLNPRNSWTYFTKMNPISFPQLEYLHWSVPSRWEEWPDEESLGPDLERESLLQTFISNHSRRLRCLWLNTWSPNSIHTNLIFYAFVALDLDLSHSPEAPSIDSLCALMKASPSLVTFALKTPRFGIHDQGPEVELVVENAVQTVALNLRECIFVSEAQLIFQILCCISMPKLEALKVICYTRSRIRPRLLHSALPISFPNLVAVKFLPLRPILAHFLSIAVFPCLRELSLYNDHPLFDHTPALWECEIFQHCNTISFLLIRGSTHFRNWVLNQLARRNISLQSLYIAIHTNECLGGPVFNPVPAPPVYSLTIEDRYSSNLADHQEILETLPTIEMLTLDVPLHSLGSLGLETISQGSLLPRLKTLKFFFESRSLDQETEITRIQCSGLLKFLRCRVEAGYGLDTFVCNYRIAPSTVVALKEYVHEVIHGDNPEYCDHQYYVFGLDTEEENWI